MKGNLWEDFFQFRFNEIDMPDAEFNDISIFKSTATNDLDVFSVVTNFKNSPYKDNALLNRAIGTIMGNAIGDSMGSILEFVPINYARNVIHDFHEYYFTPQSKVPDIQNRFKLKAGQHTDDFSMALCLYDSLLINERLNCIDLRHRFLRWWTSGYNNDLRFDETRKVKTSIGLGGNIMNSFLEITKDGIINEKTKSGNPHTNGNGSIMRMSAVPLFYHKDLDAAIRSAGLQSYTTHQGNQAADCCRIMSFIIFKALHSEKFVDAKTFIGKLDMSELIPKLKTDGAKSLALSKQEKSPKISKFCKGPQDADWNWKNSTYKYSETRTNIKPGYIGSYAMDGLAMALHCVYTTKSFEEALLKIVNMGGDADTVGAIGGQIAGAIYGIENIKPTWSFYVMKWDNMGEIPLRAMCCILPELKEKVIDKNAIIKITESHF